MTVKQFLENRYCDKMLNMTEREWKRIKEICEYSGKHPAEVVYMAFEITEFDIKANGGYKGELYEDIRRMHENKLLASNKHRQYHGKVDAWWLTKKGFKDLGVL